uniref:uncharacterized protein n=1 Tax=Semicossyphus pulcher TaxID=241346 RepID=UPI0037E8E424
MADLGDDILDEKPPKSHCIAEFKAEPEEKYEPTAGQKIAHVQRLNEGTERMVLGMQLTQPTQPSQPVYEAVPSEDTAVKLLKAPVVWSAHTVKAAVSRISGVQQTQSAHTTPLAPEAIKQEEDSGMLPKSPVAWSPLTVKAAVSRLSGVQSTQLPPPSPHVSAKRPAGDALRSTTPHKRCILRRQGGGSADIKVVQAGSQRSRILHGPWRRVGENLIRGRFKRVTKSVMSVPGFKDIMVSEVLRQLDKECETLTSLTFNSTLRESDPQALRDFSWNKVMGEWKTAAPIFLRFLQHASKVFKDSTARDTPAPKDKTLPMVMSGALLLKARSPFMSAPMYINSMTMQQGGVSKRCMDRLNRLGVCMSNRRMLDKRKDIEETRDGKLESEGQADTLMEDSSEEKDVNYEEGDGTVPEITYIVS